MNKSPNDFVLKEFHVRRALIGDAPHISKLIDVSIRKLAAKYYDSDQIESSLKYLFGVDSTMIADRTYFIVEVGAASKTERLIVAAGGWSHRKTPFGGDQETAVRDAGIRDPNVDPAVIRAMYVHPDWARRKLGHLIITTCEHAARKAGYSSFELFATLSGVEFYLNQGYVHRQNLDAQLPDGTKLPICRMTKNESN